jgi:hypothetical protein
MVVAPWSEKFADGHHTTGHRRNIVWVKWSRVRIFDAFRPPHTPTLHATLEKVPLGHRWLLQHAIENHGQDDAIENSSNTSVVLQRFGGVGEHARAIYVGFPSSGVHEILVACKQLTTKPNFTPPQQKRDPDDHFLDRELGDAVLALDPLLIPVGHIDMPDAACFHRFANPLLPKQIAIVSFAIGDGKVLRKFQLRRCHCSLLLSGHGIKIPLLRIPYQLRALDSSLGVVPICASSSEKGHRP